MKRVAAIVALLALGACGVVAPSYRDQDVRIASLAAFDPVRYAGDWVEVARFPVPFQAGCVDTRARYGPPVDGALSVENVCTTDEGRVRRISGSAALVGPGRLKVRLGSVPFAGDYWVLWVDESYETAVVGVPSGRAGWVLSRESDIRADKLAAALEVLAFNGYDTSALIYRGGIAP